jgi:hypothetical protein
VIKVRVYSGETLIGDAELAAADPPMGVAAGNLNVRDSYTSLRPLIERLVMSETPNWTVLALTVTLESNELVDAVGGVQIEDFIGNDLPPQVVVAGIDCAGGKYEEWFGNDPAYLSYYGGNS